MGVSITGWGTALPEKVVTNADFESRMDTTDAWIVERTGIRERRWGGTTVGLSVESAQRAMAVAGATPASVELLLLATTTPDQQVPGSSSSVQHALGLRCGAVDVNAACSGFAYGLVMAAGMAEMGVQRSLVIGTDTLSRITDHDDRGTAILFADGSGAVVVDRVEGPGNLLAWDLGSDGSLRHVLDCEIGGFIQMQGREVFRQAVTVMVASGRKTLAAAGVTQADVALVVPHQANTRIITSAMEKLGIPEDRAALVLERTGNTSSASIPLALVDAVEAGRVATGDLVLLVGFGAGMTWASALLRWGAE
jgi:3-oxoacyl-[acyl-carrier-protein] synthase III